MKKVYLLLLTLGVFSTSYAGYNPLSLTGFNEDVIANGTGTVASSISANLPDGFDGGLPPNGYALVSQDYNYNGNVPTYYLPTGGLLTSSLTTGLTFQLADYSSNNALYLVNTNDSGSLALATPQSEGSLYILGTTGSAGSTPALCNATVYFSDGTSQTFTGLSYPDWYNGIASGPGIGRVSVPNNTVDGDANNPHMFEVRVDLDPANYTKTIDSVSFKKTNSSGRLGIFAITGVGVCTGVPTPGTISATLTSGCGSYYPELSLSGQSTDAGLTYQWQSSATGTGTWTNVAGQTNTTFVPNVIATIYYRMLVTCSSSGDTASAAPVELTNSGPAPVTATLPYFQGFENWIAGCYTFDRPDASWTENPPTSDNAWRREDQGTDANWYLPTNGAYSPSSTEGAHSADFHSSEDGGGAGDLDLYIDLSPAGTKAINFDFINTSTSSSDLTVDLSEDGGLTFTTLGTYDANSGWTPEQITTNSVASNAVIRFEGYGDESLSDMGIDSLNVYVLPACTGTPTAGSFNASNTSGCTPYTSVLTLDTPTILSDIAYQWQSSPNGVNWTSVAGATTTTYTASVTANVYYRIYVECTATSTADTSLATELMFLGTQPAYATLPFFEGFETWTGICYTYDRPVADSNWDNTPSYGNNSWRRDDQGDDAGWDFTPGGVYSPSSTEGSHSARFHSYEYNAGVSGNLDLYVDLSATGTKQINFDYINGDEFGGSTLNVLVSTDSGQNFTSIGTYGYNGENWTSESIITNITAPHVTLRFQGNGEYTDGDMGMDSLYIHVLPPCSGQPVAGVVNQTHPNSSCSAFTDTFTVATPIYATGIVYQWQTSTNDTDWTNVGTNSTTYVQTISTPLNYFRFLITCTISGNVDSSAAVTTNIVVPVAGIATVPYFQGFENWIGTCYNFDRPDSNWLTSPSYGDNSWRRDDQGGDAGWDYTPGGAYTPVSTQAAHSARFHTDEATIGVPGNMDLHINLSAAGPKAIDFDYINITTPGSSSADSLMVELSEDTGATWTTLGIYDGNSGWMPEYLFTNSTAPDAIIRFIASTAEGSFFAPRTDIGIDSLSITPAITCSGTPTAGNIDATQYTGCSSFDAMLTLDVDPTIADLSYNWQTSPDGTPGSWTNVSPLDTLSSYAAYVTGVVYYRATVTCQISGLADTTSSVELQIVTPEASYAALPYFQGFENWEGTCTLYDRPDTNWLNTPYTGDNSWRRDDQGSDASWDDLTEGAYTPTSSEGLHSARFHASEIYQTPGDLDLYVDLSAVGTKAVNFDYINLTSGDATMTVELSENGANGPFTTIGTYGSNSGWTSYELYTNSVASQAVIRFEGNGEFSTSDVGLDSVYVHVLPPCSGQPLAGDVNQTQATGCSAYYDTLSPAIPQQASNVTYQWQSSSDGTTWTNIQGATNMTDVQLITTTVSNYFRFIVTCTISEQSDTSTSAIATTTHALGVATVPYFQGFENWIGACYNNDLPDSNWLNIPNYGNDSWRRDDQGDDAGWDASYDGAYTPASSEGSHSARFHVYEAPAGTSGSLELHVNLSTPGTKDIYFDLLNNSSSGDPYMIVDLSLDSGTTFTTLNTFYPVYGSTWQPELFTTTSVSPHAILRFTGYSDFSNNDMGIDSLYIGPPPCDTVLNLTATNITATGAYIAWDSISGVTGYLYSLDQNAMASGTGTLIDSADYAATGLTPGTTYYFHLLTNCGPGDSSAWETITFTTADTCYPPTNLQLASLLPTSAILTWTAPAGANGYDYVLDNSSSAPGVLGTFTATNSATVTPLTDSTNYCFHVRTDCSNGDSSSWVTTCFFTPGLGVANIGSGNFSVVASPNPAANKVNITVYGTQFGKAHLRLTDVTGKVIQIVPLNGDKVTLDINTLASGIYFINYVDDAHNQVIKLVKDE